MKFSFTEQVDILLIYGEAQQTLTRTQALYIKWYSDQMHPSHHMFQRICKKLRETGILTVQKSERRNRVCHEDNEINMLATVNSNPQISLRQNVSSIVRRVLDYDVLVSGGGVRVSDVTRGEGV